jgi:hypothetical protein
MPDGAPPASLIEAIPEIGVHDAAVARKSKD